MVKINLTEQEELLMKRVCDLQLNSFEKMLNGQGEFDVDDKFKDQVSESEIKEMITEVVKQYMDISHKPELLFQMHADLLGNFREAINFNASSLSDFTGELRLLKSKIDYAIFIAQHKN
jgi:hypothetical protein